MRLIGLLAPALLLAIACSDSTSAPDPRAGIPDDALVVRADSIENLFYHYRAYSPVKTRERIIVRDRRIWAAAWEQLTQADFAPVIAPVDFDRHMVVIASMGNRHTGGFNIAITGIYQLGDDLYVVVDEISPGRGCGVPMAETHPITAARVPRLSGTVHFVERESFHHCL